MKIYRVMKIFPQTMSESISDRGDCKTAQTRPGLLRNRIPPKENFFMVSVLLSAKVERFSVSCMRFFLLLKGLLPSGSLSGSGNGGFGPHTSRDSESPPICGIFFKQSLVFGRNERYSFSIHFIQCVKFKLILIQSISSTSDISLSSSPTYKPS